MQGSDLDELLYDYYDTVNRIETIEKDHNNYVRQIWSQIMMIWPNGMERHEFEKLSSVTADRFQALQPYYQEILNEPVARLLIERTSFHLSPLLLQYEKLARLGSAFSTMVEADTTTLNDTALGSLANIYDPNSGIGYPDIIVDGQIAWRSYYFANTSTIGRAFKLQSLKRSGDSLHLAYPGGADWAAIWLAIGVVKRSWLA